MTGSLGSMGHGGDGVGHDGSAGVGILGSGGGGGGYPGGGGGGGCRMHAESAGGGGGHSFGDTSKSGDDSSISREMYGVPNIGKGGTYGYANAYQGNTTLTYGQDGLLVLHFITS